MVLDAPDIESVLPEFLEFVGDGVLVAHNAGFDVGFIEQNCRYQEIEPDFVSVDTVALARVLLPTLSKYKLNIVAKALGISLENHHRAVDDAGANGGNFREVCRDAQRQEYHNAQRDEPVWGYECECHPEAANTPYHHSGKKRYRKIQSVPADLSFASDIFCEKTEDSEKSFESAQRGSDHRKCL